MSKNAGKRGRPPGSTNKPKSHQLTLTLIGRILKNPKLHLSDQTVQSLQVLAAIANGNLKEIVKTLLETIAADPAICDQGLVFEMIREDFGFEESAETGENVEVVETSEVGESEESSGMTEITADAA